MSTTYYDRAEGQFVSERIYGERFLSWSYRTRSGRFFTELIFRHKSVSGIYGWLNKQALSRRKIKPFVKKMNLPLRESIRPLEDFKSFNDFFTREIDLSKRPIHSHPSVCVAPADGRVMAFYAVEADRTFRIKSSTFNLRQFLHEDGLARQFAGGSMVISRLSLTDYHHFHFPDSGIPRAAVPVPGKCYAGGAYALDRPVPFYIENYRMVTLLDSEHFDQMVMVEVGAFTVGSIQQRYVPGIYVQKGARKGFFELGGSTVVLIFRRGVIELDEDLLRNSRNQVETYVRLGDSLGRRPGSSSGA
jgi:phosphatidylserine decarboxylase